MAGYNWNAGKSNRAIRAETDGLLPATHFAKWAKEWFSGVTSGDIKNVLCPAEWHHTSKYFNRTDYYDPRDLLELNNRDAIRHEIQKRKEKQRIWKDAKNRGLVNVNEDGDFESIYIYKSNGDFWHPVTRQQFWNSDTDFQRVKQQITQGYAE